MIGARDMMLVGERIGRIMDAEPVAKAGKQAAAERHARGPSGLGSSGISTEDRPKTTRVRKVRREARAAPAGRLV
jgi:hypothetical protein